MFDREPYSNHLKGSRKGLRPVPQIFSMIFVKFSKTALKPLVHFLNPDPSHLHLLPDPSLTSSIASFMAPWSIAYIIHRSINGSLIHRKHFNHRTFYCFLHLSLAPWSIAPSMALWSIASTISVQQQYMSMFMVHTFDIRIPCTANYCNNSNHHPHHHHHHHSSLIFSSCCNCIS